MYRLVKFCVNLSIVSNFFKILMKFCDEFITCDGTIP